MRMSIIIVCVCTLVGGCMLDSGDIPRGAPITHVQADFDLPDAISDESAGESRFYIPTNRPEYEWPADAPRTFYYLDQDLAVTFVSGKAVSAAPIHPELRERILLPLIRRRNGSE